MSERLVGHGRYVYTYYGCRCEVCVEANREHQRVTTAERTERLAADPTLVPHGRVSTYRNWGCRCEDCTRVHVATCRAYDARRREASA